MNWKLFFVTFASIFMAELGDKTQLATISFTADNAKFKWIVFCAAAGALVATTFLGVFFGHLITRYIPPKYIKIAAGALFVIIGLFMLINTYREPEISTEIARLSTRIREIQQIEKCNLCVKFNNLINENAARLEKTIKPVSENLHQPLNCVECNTEKIKKELLKI